VRRATAAGGLLAALAFLLFALGAGAGAGGGGDRGGGSSYWVELDNAFGLVQGGDMKVAGVRAGTITAIDLDRRTLHAIVHFHVTETGFGSLRTDVSCATRPQSLIGEYYLDCEPGTSPTELPAGSVIPVTRTATTVAPDLVTDVFRLPYRQRLQIIISELGAGAAGNAAHLRAAIRRASPALRETDQVLAILARQNQTLAALARDGDQVLGALAANRRDVARFVDSAGRTAAVTAAHQAALAAGLRRLPGFLAALGPAMSSLGDVAGNATPALRNLDASAGQLKAFLDRLGPFATASRPAFRALGRAAVTGRAALIAAAPTVGQLNQFAGGTPELAKNLDIVLRHLDDRSFAVEKDPRSPGGQGYTGLEALLQYVFNQPLAINTFGPFGHQLTVDAFVSAMCTPYATPATISTALSQYGSRYRSCYSWLGAKQPGVNVTDPSAPGAAVPDPGGSPPGEPGPATSAAKLAAANSSSTGVSSRSAASGTPSSSSSAAVSQPSASSGSSGTSAPVGTSSGASSGTGAASGSGAPSGNNTQQLLNYLLSP
jgi:virulence factor Mce-like protein